MALIEVTKDNAHEFASAIGVSEYIRANDFRNIDYKTACPLYTNEFFDSGLSAERLCRKNCSVRDLVKGVNKKTDLYLNCCAVYRLSALMSGKSLTLYLCDSLLDCDVVDI